MDPSPVMRILADAECQEENMINSSNDCVVVEGDFVVYTDGTGEADTEVVEDAVRFGLEDTELLKSNGHVDRVTFVEHTKNRERHHRLPRLKNGLIRPQP
jgi:isoleucyl-tRNA synthetase